MAAKDSVKAILKKLGLTPTQRTYLDGLVYTVTMAAAAGSANVAEVTLTVKNADGTALAVPTVIDFYISDAATGIGLTASAPSTGIAAKTSNGALVGTLTSTKAIRIITKADGTAIIQITDTGKTAYYPVVVNPVTGAPIVGTQLITANYG